MSCSRQLNLLMASLDKSFHHLCGYCLLAVTWLVISSAHISQAVEFKGSFSSELFIFSQGAQSHLRPYESIRGSLSLYHGVGTRQLSFVTYTRWTTDLRDKQVSDPQFYFYDSYFKAADFVPNTRLYVGRQFVYSSVGSAQLDGIRLQVDPHRKIQIDLYGGSTVNRLDPERIRSLTDFGAIGGRVALTPRRHTLVGFNWQYRKYDGSVSYHRLGLDLRQSVRSWQLYTRIAYDMVGLQVADIMTRLAYTKGDWYLSGEFDLREPSVPSNSVFSIIDFNRYRQVRIDAQRMIIQGLFLTGEANVTFTDDDYSFGTRLGLRTAAYSVSWIHQDGYGGDNDGFSGYLNYRPTDRWTVFARAYLSKYRVQDEQIDRSEAYSTGLGLSRRFPHAWLVSAEWQYLRNAVRSNDNRLYFRLTKDLSLKADSK